jgi:hypothetical protein
MAKIATTTQKKKTTTPGIASPATVLALVATAASYPPAPALFLVRTSNTVKPRGAATLRPMRELRRGSRVATAPMRTTIAPRVSRRARRVSHTPAAHGLARAGLLARGIIYVLLGWVAVLVALGHGRHEADQQGALQLLAGKPYGSVSLWLLCIGLVPMRCGA